MLPLKHRQQIGTSQRKPERESPWSGYLSFLCNRFLLLAENCGFKKVVLFLQQRRALSFSPRYTPHFASSLTYVCGQLTCCPLDQEQWAPNSTGKACCVEHLLMKSPGFRNAYLQLRLAYNWKQATQRYQSLKKGWFLIYIKRKDK